MSLKRVTGSLLALCCALAAVQCEAVPEKKAKTEIQFLGTGAADYPWKTALSPALRGSCSTLLDGHILIDAGTTALWNLRRAGINPAAITDLFVTHTHSDHFKVPQILAIAHAPGRTGKLRVHAGPEALAKLDDSVRKHPLHWGDRFSVGAMKVLVTPANHIVRSLAEDTFHFLLEINGKRLYYALDGGWMTARERAMLGKAPLDMIVWDATCGNTFDDWRFAEHNDLNMIRSMIVSMTKAGLVRKDTVHVFDHTGMTLWPKEEAAKEKLAKEYGGVLASDGMKLFL